MSFEAVLQLEEVVPAAVDTCELTGQAVLADNAEGGNSRSAAATVEQRLQVSYVLPTGEAVSSPQITSTPSSTTDEAAVAEAAATPDKQSLKWSFSHLLAVTEAIVCNLASSNAAFAMTFAAASRTVTKTAEAVTPPPAAAKPAKAIKGVVTDEVPWQADQQHVLAVDLAPLLVGDTALVCALPQKGLAMPVQLQAYSTVQVHVEVRFHPSLQQLTMCMVLAAMTKTSIADQCNAGIWEHAATKEVYEISIQLVNAKLISHVACLTLHLYPLLKQQGFTNQALLKSQVLINQEGAPGCRLGSLRI